MKIAVTSAFGWPYVRRGNRVAYELARYLAGRGHEVHFITTKPGRTKRKKIREKVLIEYHPLIEHPLITRFKVHYWQMFGLPCLSSLLREDFDIVHTTSTLDGFAASINRSVKGTPFVPVVINADPLYRDARRCKWMFNRIVRKASGLVTISNYVNAVLKKEFGVDGIMIPCPVDTSKFFPAKNKDINPPRILCTAALTQERKRIPLLVKAFEILIGHVPDAILQLAGETNNEITKDLLMSVNLRTRNAIELLNITSDETLASVYRSATISVIPSINEPFGMVTTESLASGTPVVGTRSGGIPQILDDPSVGVLFNPANGPNEFCHALIKGLELASKPETSKRCRHHAERFAWKTLGPEYEMIYPEIIDDFNSKSRRMKKQARERSQILTDVLSRPINLEERKNKDSFNEVFDKELDDLDITYDTYYKIDSYRPRCIAILQWLSSKGIDQGTVLVLSGYSHFLTRLLVRFGFETRAVVIDPRSCSNEQLAQCEVLCDLQSLSEVEDRFDIIVCEDFLQYVSMPLKMLQLLKERLGKKGVLILTTPNIARGGMRLRLLAGKNVYPSVDEELNLDLTGNFSRQESIFYREYTLKELEELATKAGLAVIHRRRLIGKKVIDNRITVDPLPVKTYLLRKIYYQFQKAAAPLRTYLFLVAQSRPT